jgi:hypothetical protein
MGNDDSSFVIARGTGSHSPGLQGLDPRSSTAIPALLCPQAHYFRGSLVEQGQPPRQFTCCSKQSQGRLKAARVVSRGVCPTMTY